MTDPIVGAMAAVKRRAVRTDLMLYDPRDYGSTVACICIPEGALREVLAEVFARMASQEPTE